MDFGPPPEVVRLYPPTTAPSTMSPMVARAAPRDLRGPWFAAHPAAALAVSGALFTVVFGLGLAVTAHQDSITALFVLPIALAAFAFGERRGLVASAIALVLTAMWGLAGGVHRTLLDWLSAAVPLVLIGGLIGHASERIISACELQLRFERAQLRQREAADVNDSIVQKISVAKWMFEAGRRERGLEVLTETVDTAHALVSDLLAQSDDTVVASFGASTPPPRSHARRLREVAEG